MIARKAYLIGIVVSLAYCLSAGSAFAGFGYLSQWGTSGSGDGQFDHPAGIATQPGKVFVADSYNSRVQAFTTEGVFQSSFGSSVSGFGAFGLAAGSGGTVYVTGGGGAVYKFSTEGTLLLEWGGYGPGDGNFGSATGVATDSSGNVYVVDAASSDIQKFNSEGVFIKRISSSGEGDGELGGPTYLAVHGSRLYVSDGNSPTSSNAVEVFDTDGTPLTRWGSTGSGDGQFKLEYGATGIATDSDGNVYVVDPGNDRVQKFDQNGKYLDQWGSTGSGDGKFKMTSYGPSGIAVDSSDNVYVADSGNSRIQVFGQSGSKVNEGPKVEGTTISRKCLRVPASKRKARRRRPVFTYTLSEGASVTVEIKRKIGSAAVRGCLKTLPSQLSKSRRVAVIKQKRNSGRNTLKIPLFIAKKSLKAGVYLVEIRATDASGNSSTVETVAFQVLPR